MPLPGATGVREVLTYADLHDRTLAIARGLSAAGVREGERIIVVAENTPTACLVLLASLIHGSVAVPVSPPARGEQGEWCQRMERIARDCDAGLLVCDATEKAETCAPPGVRVVSGASLGSGRCTGSVSTVSSLDDLALVQYTSGTTSRPRGVALTHTNIFHNVRRIGESCDVRRDDVGVTWLPLFHDMGLIGTLLFTTYWGIPLVLMTPRSFMARPDSWLSALSRFRGTLSAAPNSAYQLCAAKTPDRRVTGLDLSTWRVAFNGAESVHPSTIERFSARFAACGFSRDAMAPVYGLAENTVAATLPVRRGSPTVDWLDADSLEQEDRAVPGAAGPRGRGLVCVGRTLPGQELRVADPETGLVLADRQIGEIQLRGPCTTKGYWGLPSSSQPFADGGWLRTGDRGYLNGGDLYVVGRYKHILKRMGRTLDCALVESTLQQADDLRLGAVAAFGVPDDTRGAERLVVLAEVPHLSPAVSEATKATLARILRVALSTVPDELMLVAPNTIPRTTSGKVRHSAARGAYLAERARISAE